MYLTFTGRATASSFASFPQGEKEKTNTKVNLRSTSLGKDNDKLWEFIKIYIENNISFKYLSGIRVTLSGRIARRKMATRTRTYLFYNGTSKYSSIFE